jgi:hypothetical protein
MINTFKTLGANDGFWYPTITTGIDARIAAPFARDWPARFSGNALQVEMPQSDPVLATISLFDLAGKRRARLVPQSQDMGRQGVTFPIGALEAGDYVVSIEKGGRAIGTKLIRKAR